MLNRLKKLFKIGPNGKKRVREENTLRKINDFFKNTSDEELRETMQEACNRADIISAQYMVDLESKQLPV